MCTCFLSWQERSQSSQWILPSQEFFFFNFYWSIVAVQRCVSFCCTTRWISYMCTCIPIKSFFSLGHHRALSAVPWAAQWLLTVICLIRTDVCQSQSPSSACPPLPPKICFWNLIFRWFKCGSLDLSQQSQLDRTLLEVSELILIQYSDLSDASSITISIKIGKSQFLKCSYSKSGQNFDFVISFLS